MLLRQALGISQPPPPVMKAGVRVSLGSFAAPAAAQSAPLAGVAAGENAAAPSTNAAVVAAGTNTAAAAAAAGASAAAAVPLVPLGPPQRALLEEATELLARGCGGGVAASHGNCCQLLAQLRFDERLGLSPAAARRAGGGGVEEGGVDARSLSGLALLERACTGENTRACTSLAKLYRFGNERLGVTPDPERAAAFARRRLVLEGMSEEQAQRKIAPLFKDQSRNKKEEKA